MRKGNALVFFLLGLLFVSVSTAIFFFWENQQLIKNAPLTYEECLKIQGAIEFQSYPGICQTPDGRRVTQPLSDEEKKKLKDQFDQAGTSNWKTYTDVKYQITFKYPNTYTVLESVPTSFEGTMLDQVKNNCRGPVLQDSTNPKVLIVFEVIPTESDGGFCWSNGTFTDDNKWSPSEQSWKGDYFLMKKALQNEKSIAFAGLANKGTYSLVGKEVFDQILSTFKFINTTQTSGLKKFENSFVTFNYPVNYSIKDLNNGQILFESGDKSFQIGLRDKNSNTIEDYYYLDQQYARKIMVGGKNANVYESTKGYCDGPGCTKPYVAIVIDYSADKFLIFQFWNIIKFTDEEDKIISSIKLIE